MEVIKKYLRQSASDQEISRRPLGIPTLLILLMDDNDASIPGWDEVPTLTRGPFPRNKYFLGRSIVSANVENLGHPVRGC